MHHTEGADLRDLRRAGQRLLRWVLFKFGSNLIGSCQLHVCVCLPSLCETYKWLITPVFQLPRFEHSTYGIGDERLESPNLMDLKMSLQNSVLGV